MSKRREQRLLKPWKGFNGLDILLRNPLFMKLTLVLMLNGIVSEGLWEIMTQYLQLVLGFTTLDNVRSSAMPGCMLGLLGNGKCACSFATTHGSWQLETASSLALASMMLSVHCSVHISGQTRKPGCYWADGSLPACLYAPAAASSGKTASQSHLFSLAGIVGLVNNTIGMRVLVGLMGETNMMRFGIGIYAIEMVRSARLACLVVQAVQGSCSLLDVLFEHLLSSLPAGIAGVCAQQEPGHGGHLLRLPGLLRVPGHRHHQVQQRGRLRAGACRSACKKRPPAACLPACLQAAEPKLHTLSSAAC